MAGRVLDRIAASIQARLPKVSVVVTTSARDDEILFALGALHARMVAALPDKGPLRHAEFKVTSQWGEDGIIQYLVNKVAIAERFFVEFGVENYRESNTRFLLQHDNWRGLVMDGSEQYVAAIRGEPIYWRYDITALAAFVTAENINELIRSYISGPDIGLLSIDIDGNDYWVWKAINVISPRIVICEYNSLFGDSLAVAVPYQADFQRTRAHFSNLYWGASLPALCRLADDKGYVFVGSNSAANDAFFVRKDVAHRVMPLSAKEGYVASNYRESRDKSGALTYISGDARLRLIQDMPLFDVEGNRVSSIRELFGLSSGT